MTSFIEQILKSGNKHPEKIAIQAKDVTISYERLLSEAFSIAEGLKSVKQEWIGVNTNMGWKAYASILGCWFAGKGYVPINFDFPKSRVSDIIRQTNLEYCLGDSPLKSVELQQSIDNNIIQGAKAYLLFTSGTTGKPKGVPISMDNLEAFAEHYLNHKAISFTAEDKFLQSYELTFDVSVFCFLMPFLVGGTLVLPEGKSSKQLGLFKAIQEFDVTVTSFVPSVIRLTQDFLPRVRFPKLRYSFFSGEALMGDWAKTWMASVPNAKVYNCYGPTETVIVCTEELLNNLDAAYFENNLALPLGEKFEGIELTIKNGEIVYSGAQTFSGYLNQDELDDFYSGDLAHYDENGKLIFDGRKDNQIQWNGYRIELEEIERIISHKSNGWVKTLFIEEAPLLVVFSNVNKEEIANLIADSFPAYYKPSSIVNLNELPLNTNGKIDVVALKKIALETK